MAVAHDVHERRPAPALADHAHLNREAARLEGRSPGAFLSESEQRCCGHDHSASYGPLLRHLRAERAAARRSGQCGRLGGG